MAGDDLTLRQDRLIRFLLTSPTAATACRRAKISETAYYNWVRDDPAFNARLKEARQRVFDETVTSLVGVSGLCLEAVADGLGKKNATRDRLRAAKIGLDQLVKIAPIADLAEQIQQLRLELAGLNAARKDDVPGHVPGLPATPAANEQGVGAGGAGEPGAVGFEERPDPAVQGDGLAGGPVAGEVPQQPDGDEEFPSLLPPGR